MTNVTVYKWAVKLTPEDAEHLGRLTKVFGFDDRATFLREVLKQLEGHVAQLAPRQLEGFDFGVALKSGVARFGIILAARPETKPDIEQPHRPVPKLHAERRAAERARLEAWHKAEAERSERMARLVTIIAAAIFLFVAGGAVGFVVGLLTCGR